jgi:uracil-DNA glycosylase family 4
MNQIIVPPKGPKQCILAIVGQAPGEVEVMKREPFVGPSGHVLDAKLSIAGIPRNQCYLTNLVKTKPPNNDFSIYWKGIKPTEALLRWRAELLKELEEIETNVILALGGDALWALTGQRQIGKWRGSILTCNLNGREVKVIGTYHPAIVIRQWELGAIIQFDIQKALEESKFPYIVQKDRKLHIAPTFNDVLALSESTSIQQEFSFDIETSFYEITCVGIGTSPTYAMSIPTTKKYWGSFQVLRKVLECLENILSFSHGLKIAQQILFDAQYLIRLFGILPSPPLFDTMVAAHACYLELPKGLDFLTSIFTDVNYYKDDLKIWKEGTVGDERLWEYNAKDACVTIEIKQELVNEMEELNVTHTYDYMMSLIEPFLFLSLKGIRVDESKMDEVRTELERLVKEKEDYIKNQVGEINLRSPQQIAKLAYQTLGLTPVFHRKTGKITTGSFALEKLSQQNTIFSVIKDVKKLHKLLDNYISGTLLDPIDKRWKFSINTTMQRGKKQEQYGTETLRLSTSESIFGCGGNIQNIPLHLRNIFIPDDEMVFTEADLVGAEAMVMAYLIDDPVQIQAFEEGKNIHVLTAKLLFDKDEDFILADKEKCEKEGRETQSLYYKAKRVKHAANYAASWRVLSEILKIPAAVAKKLLQKYYDTCPQLSRYHTIIANKLKIDRTIITPLRTKRVFYGRYGDSLIREAIAFVPQETVVHVVNIGLQRIYNELCSSCPIDILAQVHDSLLTQHPPEITDFVHLKIKELMKVNLNINGKTFFIPVKVKTGKNWRDLS